MMEWKPSLREVVVLHHSYNTKAIRHEITEPEFRDNQTNNEESDVIKHKAESGNI